MNNELAQQAALLADTWKVQKQALLDLGEQPISARQVLMTLDPLMQTIAAALKAADKS